jgi:hypothetical protein
MPLLPPLLLPQLSTYYYNYDVVCSRCCLISCDWLPLLLSTSDWLISLSSLRWSKSSNSSWTSSWTSSRGGGTAHSRDKENTNPKQKTLSSKPKSAMRKWIPTPTLISKTYSAIPNQQTIFSNAYANTDTNLDQQCVSEYQHQPWSTNTNQRCVSEYQH